jgi:hypothetical protein
MSGAVRTPAPRQRDRLTTCPRPVGWSAARRRQQRRLVGGRPEQAGSVGPNGEGLQVVASGRKQEPRPTRVQAMSSAAAQPRPSATEATFLVATDHGDDLASAAVLETALQLPEEADARVVLYDRSAESLVHRSVRGRHLGRWPDPHLGTAAVALAAAQPWLRLPGRAAHRRPVNGARGHGLVAVRQRSDGHGPLLCRMGRDSCGAAARIAHPSGARLCGYTLAAFQANLRGVEILLVDADGGVHQIAGTAGKPQLARAGALVGTGATRQRCLEAAQPTARAARRCQRPRRPIPALP